VKRQKFRALVTLYPESDGVPRGELSPSPRRMVLRGRNADSGRCQVFTALVNCGGNHPFRPGSPRVSDG
jgi:hypothetical protein